LALVAIDGLGDHRPVPGYQVKGLIDLMVASGYENAGDRS